MTTVSIDKAEKELAALIERVRQGEEIVIADGSEPGVKLALVEQQAAIKPSLRARGIMKGQAKVSDEDLFGPMSEDELKRWWGADKSVGRVSSALRCVTRRLRGALAEDVGLRSALCFSLCGKPQRDAELTQPTKTSSLHREQLFLVGLLHVEQVPG